MASFVSKPILTTQTIGEQLRKAREGAGRSLDELSHTLGIKSAYLEAIELGSYQELPGDIYGLEFTRRYAAALRMDPNRAVALHRAERARSASPKQAWRAFHQKPMARFRAQWLFRGLAAAGSTAVLFYAVMFGKTLFGPPELEIVTPLEYQEVQDSRVVVQGAARNAVEVFLNGELVPVQRDGSFTQSLSLPAGYHLLRITALGRGGRETTEFRAVRVLSSGEASVVLRTNN